MSSEERTISGDVVIRFDNVSKRYRLNSFDGLRHLVQNAARRLTRPGWRPEPAKELWALKDVSFEVRRGEILGIIGLNGAGKSTILKLISNITHKTSGKIDVEGQVGALIEVGAGFHPELSGKENVYLYGSILGMTRQEIEDKYDSIVDFAELDGFMDMPVKKYSSGMYVRLGFSVAAHTDPDILLVDEVLAVGDAGFQAKCVNKIQELRDLDATIILVSHNMYNIARYSDRVLWVDRGQIKQVGDPDEATEAYLESIKSQEKKEIPLVLTENESFNKHDRVFGDGQVTIEDVFMTKSDGTPATEFDTGEVAQVHINYNARKPIANPAFCVSVLDKSDRYIGAMSTKYDGHYIDSIHGSGTVTFQFNPLILIRGNFDINVNIRDGNSDLVYSYFSKACSFVVNGPSLSNFWVGGDVNLPHSWVFESEHQ